MLGLLTIGLIGLALCTKKRGVAGVGALSRFEWNIYRDLITQFIRLRNGIAILALWLIYGV